MSTAETVFVIFLGVLILLAIGNVVFSVVAERRNPPIGTFTECDGVRLHYLDRGDPTAPCVVLFHGNGSVIQDDCPRSPDRLSPVRPCWSGTGQTHGPEYPLG